MTILRATHEERIGPGILVLVIGPSGAGKDTLINLAREQCQDRQSINFPRRIVTRPASDSENNETLNSVDFARAAAAGIFALHWQAHGLCYGIPAAIDFNIRCGQSVICNVSRTIVQEARARYVNCSVILITAPPEVLAERLMHRNRASDNNLIARLARSAPDHAILKPDYVIENIGDPGERAAQLLRFVTRAL